MNETTKPTESVGYYEFKRIDRLDSRLDQRAKYSFDEDVKNELYKKYLEEEKIRKATLDVENQ